MKVEKIFSTFVRNCFLIKRLSSLRSDDTKIYIKNDVQKRISTPVCNVMWCNVIWLTMLYKL